MSEELLTIMKQMNPQDLKNALMPSNSGESCPHCDEKEELYEFSEAEEKLVFEHIDPNEPVYERPIMTPELYYRIMSNEFSRDQVEYIIMKGLGF